MMKGARILIEQKGEIGIDEEGVRSPSPASAPVINVIRHLKVNPPFCGDSAKELRERKKSEKRGEEGNKQVKKMKQGPARDGLTIHDLHFFFL